MYLEIELFRLLFGLLSWQDDVPVGPLDAHRGPRLAHVLRGVERRAVLAARRHRPPRQGPAQGGRQGQRGGAGQRGAGQVSREWTVIAYLATLPVYKLHSSVGLGFQIY